MIVMAYVQDLINLYFPPSEHPYRRLEAAIDAAISPSSTILEVGCGRTAPSLARLQGKANRLIGVDVVEFSSPPPGLELYNTSADSMPQLASESVDVAFSRSVMEHLDNPDLTLREIHRVLRPGGKYIALTPSFWDYGSLIAWMIPNSLHPRIVKFAEGRPEIDTFPTRYKANTRRAVTKLAATTGLQIEAFVYLGQYPNYFTFNRFLFWLGCHYERFLQRHPLLHPLLGWAFYVLTKPSTGRSAPSAGGFSRS
jgi:SAM-dependent methyltransferase